MADIVTHIDDIQTEIDKLNEQASEEILKVFWWVYFSFILTITLQQLDYNSWVYFVFNLSL